MKKTLLLIVFSLGFISQVVSQEIPKNSQKASQELYDFHIRKKKANKLAGWITLVGGVAMIVGGYGINMSGGIVDGDSTNNNKGLWLSYLGGATTLASIPLFISAGKHKKKAKLQLQQGAIGLYDNVNYSGLSISFTF
ncbi:hypothetical protein [Pontimicrobium aquaticum]|uniref:Uncharacterized protein n=1 Tax=Pontimicrobium aquaticum TaxID=2565367 RepID=A0A4U0EST4_9FLAO|nr:hypothetical protein [Pontimicrobium aquaticum]TJY34668.1 hypothetical protein E5167_10170 [Pontimicrobium aquaticum]